MDTFWSNGCVPAKKTHQILVNFDKDAFAEIDRIARSLDRPRGYVVRALAVRGLALYRTDSLLRVDEPADNVVATITSERAEVQRQFQKDLESQPVQKQKQRRVR